MTGSPRDQRHYEPPSAEALEAEFPGWRVFRGVGETGWYARKLRTSPEVLRRGADLAELRNMLIGWKWAHERR